MGDNLSVANSGGTADERPYFRLSLQVPSNMSGAWSAINISLSALLYLFDFATNLLTLHTYYLYSVVCPQLYTYESPECEVIRKGHSFISVFYVCLALMVVAHLSNTLIFWTTLDPSQHPLRLAYFLPLIHLSRLLKVLCSTCSCNRLEDLQDNQKESSSLYNVLAASLETAPQLMLQFHVLMEFGEENNWPRDYTDINAGYDYSVIAEPVKKTLILSLLASLVSGTYNGSVAVLSLLHKRGITSLQWKACILTVAGLHILAAMAAKTLIVAALAQYVTPVLAYMLIGVIITWIFFAFVLRKSIQYSSNNHKRWVHGVHSLTLAHVSLFIGPMYVIVKYFDRPTSFLMWGTILHIFVELLGLGAVLATLGANAKNPLPHWPAWETPCHYNIHTEGEIRDNIYLSCNVFVAAVLPLLLLLIISSLVFAMVVKRATSCESKHQLANLNVSQYEHELAVLDVASNLQMETKFGSISSCRNGSL